MRNARIAQLTAGLLVLGLMPGTLLAGTIFLRGRIVDGKFAPPAKTDTGDEGDSADAEPETTEVGYAIRYATIAAKVAGGRASIESEETIAGPEEGVSVVGLIPLPANSRPVDVAIAVGATSTTRKPVAKFQLLDGEEAESFLKTLVKTTGDVGFAAFMGRPLLLLPELELGRRASLSLSFDSRPAVDAVSQLVVPTPHTNWASGPVERLSITTTVESASGNPLRTVFSPTHGSEIERTSLETAVARVRQSETRCEDDYRLLWVEDEGDLGLRVLPFRLDGEDDGYLMVVGNPTGRADGSDALDKDVTFVLDTSGSMRGEKIEQCRAAIEYCLDHLGEGDRFNVVTFGTEVRSFREELVENSAKNVDAARDFVEGIVARGRTNIGGALEAALAGERTEGRPRITIFLTDGTPTAGELVPDAILEAATAANTSESSVYVLGVGHDVNVHLLDRLAESTEGAAEFVEPDEEIDVTVAGMYDRLAHPVLTDVSIEFEGLQTHSFFPRKIPSLYRNSEVVLFGRYREGGRATVSLSGSLAGRDREYTVEFKAPQLAQAGGFEFVPPLWASRKIGYLLQEMRLHGEDPELLEEVVRLSKKYGIVTEYTQFVATRATAVRDGGVMLAADAYGANLDVAGALPQLNANRFAGRRAFARTEAMSGFGGRPGEVFDEAAAVREVTRQIAMARKQETGRWAFNQAVNEKDLQKRLVTTGEANAYVDRRGRKLDFDRFVKHVGGRCFYLDKGQWCEAEEAGERKERVVELYSKEYFALLESHEDFRKAQKLGWAISINIGDERVVVEKEGKRSDLPEPPKAPEQQLQDSPVPQEFAPRREQIRQQLPVPQRKRGEK